MPRRKVKAEVVRWRKYKCVIRLETVLGTIPAQKELRKYVKQRYKAEFKGDLEPDIELEKAEAEISPLARFRCNEKGIYFVPGQVYGLMKDAVRAAKLSRVLTLIHLRFFISPRRIYVGKKKPDDIEIIPIKTRYGNILSPHELLRDVRLEFTIETMDEDFIRFLPLLIEYAKRIGMGALRTKREYGVILEFKCEEVGEEG